MKEWTDTRQKRRQKADAEVVVYTSRALSGSSLSCTSTDADEVVFTSRVVSGSSSSSISTDAEEVV